MNRPSVKCWVAESSLGIGSTCPGPYTLLITCLFVKYLRTHLRNFRNEGDAAAAALSPKVAVNIE